MAKKIYCAFGTDIDSVAGWIGSYGGGDSPSDIQRGIFAMQQACHNCGGRGQIIAKPCKTCHGNGRVQEIGRAHV